MTEALRIAADNYDAINFRRTAAHEVTKERYPVPEGASGEEAFEIIAVRGIAMAWAERLLGEADAIMDATLAAEAEAAAHHFEQAAFEAHLIAAQPAADELITEALHDAYDAIAREETARYFNYNQQEEA